MILTPYEEGALTPDQLGNLQHLSGFAPLWYWWKRREKKPQSPSAGVGKVSEPTTAGTLAEALEAMRRRDGGGVGVLVSAGVPGLVGIDLDHVIHEGELHPLGLEAIERFSGTYVEVSPSGTGLRIFCTGGLPAGTPAGSTATGQKHGGMAIKFEAYSAKGPGRFLRTTGATLEGTAGVVGECQAGIDWLSGLMQAAKAGQTGAKSGSPVKVNGSGPGKGLSLDGVFAALEDLRPVVEVEAVISGIISDVAAKPRSKLAEAWRGGLVPWSGDWSTADLYLCCEVVRRGAACLEDVVRVWSESGLGKRDKLNREDYRVRSIDQAARKVLSDLQAKGCGPAGGGAAAPLPAGLLEALEKSGDVLTRNRAGRLESDPGNVVVLFRNDPTLTGLLAFNELAQCAVRRGPWTVFDRGASTVAGPLNDDDVTRAGMWLSREYGMKLEKRELLQGMEAAARDASYDPLRDRLIELRNAWDGVRRVDSWLVKYLKIDAADCAEYVAAVGRCFLVGAVARALRPGCQMDTVLAVEGSGGGGKSTAFKVLADAVGSGLFADSVQDVSSTSALVEGTGGRWLVELAELAGVRRAADIEALKAALTRTVDTYRRPYDVLPRELPRRFVFVATTNRTEYLADPTGALLRRFWPVRTLATEADPIDRDSLASVAGQLWGEAVRLYEAGAKWHLDESDGEAFRQWTSGRELRREDGAFHDELVGYLREWVAGWFADERGSWRSLAEIASGVGDLRTIDGDQASRNRLADTLRSMGMQSVKRSGVKRWGFTPAGARQAVVWREQAQREAKSKA